MLFLEKRESRTIRHVTNRIEYCSLSSEIIQPPRGSEWDIYGYMQMYEIFYKKYIFFVLWYIYYDINIWQTKKIYSKNF
jgi:hypothetical protein